MLNAAGANVRWGKAHWQWQPDLDSHDPFPPITINPGVSVIERSCSFAAAGTVTVASFLRVHVRAVQLAAVSGISVSGLRIVERSTSFSATAVVTIAGQRTLLRSLAFSGASAISIAGQVIPAIPTGVAAIGGRAFIPAEDERELLGEVIFLAEL